MRKLGILVLAHGSEVPGGEIALAELVAFLRTESGAVVEVGYLSFQSPSIAEAVACLLETGVDRLQVAPFFLAEGFLLRKAVRAAKEAALALRPELDIKIASPLGQHPRLLDVVMDRIAEAMDQPAE